MPDYEVVLKTVPPLLIASRTVTIPTNDQVPEYLDAAYREVWEHIGKHGAKSAPPCSLAVWHQPAEVLANEQAEAAVPVDRTIPSSDRVQVYELPQTQVAAVVHHGNFEDFQQGHKALLKWIEDNGYRSLGHYRELYIHHDPADLANSATEIQYPVEKV